MVFLSKIVFRKPGKGFLDFVKISVCGGGGGQGLPRLGGIGGRGGHVFIVGNKSASLKTLEKEQESKKRKVFKAGPGDNSRREALLGRPGDDIHIKVPVGVTVLSQKHVLGEINEEGEQLVVAAGALGGGPNNNFFGQKAVPTRISIDLKTIADVGLVGFPNAGKSSLLRALTRSNTKVAAYAFTTIKPALGIIQYEDFRQISMADLPGLIDGASLNRGLGLQFLKHIERTKVLVFVVDILGSRLPDEQRLRSPFDCVVALNKELEAYCNLTGADLMAKPKVLVVNKVDKLPDPLEQENMVEELLDKVKNMKDHLQSSDIQYRPEQCFEFDDYFAISAKEKMNLDPLKLRIREIMDYYAEVQREASLEEKRRLEKFETHLDMALKEHQNSRVV